MEHIKLFKCLYMYKVTRLFLDFVVIKKPFDVIRDSTSVFEAGLGC